MSAWAVVPAAALLGALVGCGVPWVVHRLATPAGTPPPASCHRCRHPLPTGWVRLDPRCPGCLERFGPPVWATVTIGIVIFAGLAAALDDEPALPAFLVVAALGLVLGVVDLACLRLPDPLVGLAALLSGAGLAAVAFAAGTPARLLDALTGAVLSGAGYLLLALLPNSRLGFGDVKLAAALGLSLGWLGWRTVLLGLVLPHVINGVVVLGLLAARRVRRDTVLPLGPALLAGAWLAVLLT